jgi:hypothetical protein
MELLDSGIGLIEVSGQVSAQPPAKKTTDLIGKETLKKRITNPPPATVSIEQRITNIEVRYPACRELLCRTVYFWWAMPTLQQSNE